VPTISHRPGRRVKVPVNDTRIMKASQRGVTVSEQDIRARLARLEELSRGFAKEAVLIGEGQDPLLYLERRAYLAAIHDILAGIESARVTLSRAMHRVAA
jgi:hypothetical protein